MENRGRTLSVDFANAVGRTVKAQPLTAIDYGQILEIHGLPLPPSFECHFSKNGSTAYKSIGTTTNGIGTVPFIDEQTQSGGIITAYIYLHETEDDGETEYRIIIPVESRPGVTPAEPTPVQQDVIAQAISALNNAVTTTTANVAITEANKNASAEHAQDAYEYADDASRSASSAHESETNAEQARLEAVSARDRAIEAKDTAHSEAQYAKSYSESAHTDAQSAGQSATSAQSSATQANTYATSASASATSATASEVSASASATSAQASAESAQASADRAEQEADRWYEFLPVDSASGSLAHITDGADSVPVKALSVSLEPIQDLHGQSSPYPAGGGKNLCPSTDWVLGQYVDGTFIVVKNRQTSPFISILPNTTYTMSIDQNGTANLAWINYNYFDVDKNWLGNRTNNGDSAFTGHRVHTFMVSDTNAKYIRLTAKPYSDDGKDISAVDAATGTPQLETGSIATSYAPYSNICPITGHTQVVVNRSDGNGGNLQSITIPLGDTVYGGTLDVTNGVLTVDKGFTTVGALTWSYDSTYTRFGTRITDLKAGMPTRSVPFLSSAFVSIDDGRGISAVPDNAIYGAGASNYVYVKTSLYTSASDFVNALGDTQIVYPLANSITVPLTANQMTTLLGINNIWSDSGDVSVDYRSDIQLYIQKMIANALNT